MLTPASSLAAIFSAASLKSNAKPAQENLFGAPTNFKTPSSKKNAAESMVISSPLRLNIRSIFLEINQFIVSSIEYGKVIRQLVVPSAVL